MLGFHALLAKAWMRHTGTGRVNRHKARIGRKARMKAGRGRDTGQIAGWRGKSKDGSAAVAMRIEVETAA